MASPSPSSSVFVSGTSRPEAASVDLLCVPVFGEHDRLEDVPGVDDVVGGDLGRARGIRAFCAKPYEALVARAAAGTWNAQRIVFVGAGAQDGCDAERVRRVAATAGYAARRLGAASVGFLVRGLDLVTMAGSVADGLSAAEFDSGTFKKNDRTLPPYPARFEVIAPGADEAAVAEAVRRGRIIGESANVARGLANEPGNVLSPRVLAARVTAEAEAVGLAVEVLDEARLHELNMRLLLGVGQGSAEPPRLIVIRHDPPGAPATPVIGLVGKGITFDTGGISIKPADGMERMKDDMAGAAAVIGAMRALKLLGGPFRAIGIIPSAENMPGGRAMRPGDVIEGASGKTVEIINTDAEGRLVLGDALWYARQQGATHIVDVATLTGACMVALGRHLSGLFGSPASWVDTVQAAAARAGDRVWPMPIYEEAREELASEIADLINSAGRAGGAVTAAAFLREFAGEGAWAHLDIAGTAWAETKTPHQPKGATGVAVRLLIEIGMTGGGSPPPASR